MKFVELPKKLKVQILPLYILKGDDYFVINSAIKHITSACGDNNDFNVNIFDDENFTANKLAEAVLMLPLGSEKRLILLKNITKLTENDKKIISKSLENMSETTCVVLVYNESWKFIKGGEIVDCGKMDYDILSKYIALELKKANKQLDPDSLRCFIELCSYNMTKISTELKKVIYYSDDPSIEKTDILSLVSPDEEFQIFQLTECLGNKNGGMTLKILSNFIEKKEPIQMLLGLISNHFRRVAHISISGMQTSELAQLFGVKEYAIQKAKEQSKYFSKIQLKNILSLLEEVDNMIKSGAMAAENAIYYLCFKILYC
jgi:DNA polymerase III delta subunit